MMRVRSGEVESSFVTNYESKIARLGGNFQLQQLGCGPLSGDANFELVCLCISCITCHTVVRTLF